MNLVLGLGKGGLRLKYEDEEGMVLAIWSLIPDEEDDTVYGNNRNSWRCCKRDVKSCQRSSARGVVLTEAFRETGEVGSTDEVTAELGGDSNAP